jgi:penicillin-binding protein 2
VRRLTSLLPLSLLLCACSLFGSSSPTSDVPPVLPDPGVTTIPAPDPDIAARSFLDAWKSSDYPVMYGMLTSLAQDGLSPEAFTSRYEEIHQAAALTDVDSQIISSLVMSPEQAEVRYRSVLHSVVVGDITREYRMDLRRENGDWKVAWTEAMILPELEGGNGLRLYQYTPTRANIYDRNGDYLAAQKDAVALWIVPNQIGDEDAEEDMLNILRGLLDVPTNDEIRYLYDSFRETDYYIPLGEVALEDFQLVQGRLTSLGGVQWERYSTRFYPGGGLTPYGGGLAPHAVGYVSWIQEEVVEDYLALGYQGDEYVGQMGLEFAYEQELRGQPGGTLYLIDPNGKEIEVLASKDSEPPYAVYTTLDRDLQLYAQQAIENFNGAVVVLERDTGALLAIASSPGFDPNLFDTNNRNYSYGLSDLLEDPNQALLNRTTLGIYPLGSIFKIITMAAALESEYYEPDTIYNCGHYFTELPGWQGTDWRLEKELPAAGEITLMQGLELSCNPYFWHIGLDLYNKGLETALPDMARGFGLGQLTGIEIDEDAGLVPDPENKVELFNEEWAVNDAVQLAIGQSFLQVTPLQVARFIAAVGNGGTLYRPQIVQSVQNAEGEFLHEFQPEVQGQLPVSSENLEAIQQAMVNVVSVYGATAYHKLLGIGFNVAGKTGTAQSGEYTNAHAWFAGYTFEERDDKPDIAIVVILEYKGEGSEWAAPVFRRMVVSYFKENPRHYIYPWESIYRVDKTPTPTPGPEDLETEGTPSP